MRVEQLRLHGLAEQAADDAAQKERRGAGGGEVCTMTTGEWREERLAAMAGDRASTTTDALDREALRSVTTIR